eukprot:IDg12043t1
MNGEFSYDAICASLCVCLLEWSSIKVIMYRFLPTEGTSRVPKHRSRLIPGPPWFSLELDYEIGDRWPLPRMQPMQESLFEL